MTDLVFDPAAMPGDAAYHLLNSLVVPRAIAWVSTLSEAGVANVAPHSYYTVLSANPPIVCFSSSGTKDTIRNVRFTNDFVVNVVDEFLAVEMNHTSADFPSGESEFAAAGLTPVASELVQAPRMAEAPGAMECRVLQILELGNAPNFVVIGEVVRFHVADRVWKDGRIDISVMRPLGRLAGSEYSYTREVYRLPRPTYKGLVAENKTQLHTPASS